MAEVVPMHVKDVVGRYGEDLAAQHLADAGLAILERNWRCPAGEIDILARDGDALVVCEVKTRSRPDFGTPLEAVTVAKASRLRRLAALWLAERRLRVAEVRFDVVGVTREASGVPAVQHIRGVL
jgi:putative endonuclease